MQDGIDYVTIRKIFNGEYKKGVFDNFNPLTDYLVRTDKDGIDWYFYKGRKLTKSEFENITETENK